MYIYIFIIFWTECHTNVRSERCLGGGVSEAVGWGVVMKNCQVLRPPA